MTGIETALLGASLGSATAGASAVGLLGAGGVFAPMAGTLFSGFSTLGTLSTIASLGSSFLGTQAQSAESEAAIVSAKTNAAIERTNSAEEESAARRASNLRAGRDLTNAAAMGTGPTGSVLDILADNTAQDEFNIIGIRRNAAITQDIAKSKVSSIKASSRLSQGASILSGATSTFKAFKGL